MIEYEVLFNDAKEALSEKRFKHSIGVVKRAIEYAKIHEVDEDIVKRVAIIHDIAKEIPKDEIINYARKIGVNLDNVEKENLRLPHAKIGAQIGKQKYNFTEDMINSIKYHTTGRKEMSILEKIIYLADATEENRKYDDLDYYVELCKKDINRAMFEVSKWTIEDLVKKSSIIHIDTVECYNYYEKYKKNQKY